MKYRSTQFPFVVRLPIKPGLNIQKSLRIQLRIGLDDVIAHAKRPVKFIQSRQTKSRPQGHSRFDIARHFMNPLKRCGWLDSIAIFITLVSQQSTIRKRCLNPPTFVDRPLIRSRIDINPIRFTHPPRAAHEHTGKPLFTTRLTATEVAHILVRLARQEPKVRTRLKTPHLLITPRCTPCRSRAATRHIKLIQGDALGRTVITHRCENRFKFPPLMPCHGLPRNSLVLRGQAQRKIKGIRRVLRQLGAIATMFIVIRKLRLQRHARC